MKLGSLFDGIGGFPLAATFHGITPVWASEIEPFPIEVTKARFPGMKHLGDITQINGAEIEPADIVTFGSPCTRLSVAGRHDGFDITFRCEGTKEEPHAEYVNNIRATDKYQYIYSDTCSVCGGELIESNESALFFHAVRIIGEMRRATNGAYPRFAVWENVPGAFSSNGGADFRAVLEEITEAEIPMPHTGRWATAGMVRGGKCEVAWRVLDAQYWGVPQRRRRIFLVADFAGQRAGEILFECQSLPGDIAESRKAREEVAAGVGNGTRTAVPINTQIATRHNKLGRGTGFGVGEDGDPCFTLHEAHSHAVFTEANAYTVRMREGCVGGGKGPLISVDKSLTLGCSNDQTLIAGTVSAKWAKGTGGPAGDECQNLVAVAYGIRTANTGANGHGIAEDKAHTLDQAQGQAVAHRVLFEPRSQDGVPRIHESEIVPTLNTAQGGQRQPCIASNYTVRRLTPLECERLQGFPDGWTDIPGASDTGRYKALGNSVAVPCVAWIMRRVAESERLGEVME